MKPGILSVLLPRPLFDAPPVAPASPSTFNDLCFFPNPGRENPFLLLLISTPASAESVVPSAPAVTLGPLTVMAGEFRLTSALPLPDAPPSRLVDNPGEEAPAEAEKLTSISADPDADMVLGAVSAVVAKAGAMTSSSICGGDTLTDGFVLVFSLLGSNGTTCSLPSGERASV